MSKMCFQCQKENYDSALRCRFCGSAKLIDVDDEEQLNVYDDDPNDDHYRVDVYDCFVL